MSKYWYTTRKQQAQLKVDKERSKKLYEVGKSLTLYYGQYLRALEECGVENYRDTKEQRVHYKEFCEKFGYNYDTNILQEVE